MTTQPPPPSQNFAGKVIAVTGASRGTGLTLSRYLLARGAKVSMCATSEARLAEALQGIEADMPEVRDRVMTAVVDISKADTVEAWINATVARFGQLNGAANVAARMHDHVYPITDFPAEELEMMLSVNVVGTFNCMKHELRHMADGGSLVNLGSIMSKWSSPGMSAYSAAKHAIVGMTKVAAFEVAGRGIRVNAVCPGTINTDMVRQPLIMPNGQAWTCTEDENLPALLKRFSQPEEIASTVAFLLGDDSRYVTKQEWYGDGGWCESAYVWS